MKMRVKFDPSLPPEIWEKILDFFETETIINFQRVCHEWRQIVQVMFPLFYFNLFTKFRFIPFIHHSFWYAWVYSFIHHSAISQKTW